jgi:hypothetical protein
MAPSAVEYPRLMARSDDPIREVTSVFRVREGRVAFVVCVASVGVFALYSLGVALVPPVAKVALAEMHVTTRPGWAWPLLHLRPSMYNFENRCVVGTRVMSEQTLDGLPGWTPTRVNHYPLQIATWWMRDFMGQAEGGAYVLCRSRYRGTSLRTLYRFRAVDGGIQVELVEP